jgi:hypothetical protein
VPASVVEFLLAILDKERARDAALQVGIAHAFSNLPSHVHPQRPAPSFSQPRLGCIQCQGLWVDVGSARPVVSRLTVTNGGDQ